MAEKCLPLHRVLEEELNELRQRRDSANIDDVGASRLQAHIDRAVNKPPGGEGPGGEEAPEDRVSDFRAAYDADVTEEAVDDTSSGPRPVDYHRLRHRTGLALSGGGIRSASFGLGFLQALYRHGMLRQLDYLSTVSGGGYIGTYLTSLALHEQSRLRWDEQQGRAAAERDDADACEKLDIAPAASGAQPVAVQRLINGGMTLRKPLVFMNQYLLGLLSINFIIVSGMICLAAAAAALFRCLDYPAVMDFAAALGFSGDVRRAFFPACVMLLIWVVLSFFLHIREQSANVATTLEVSAKWTCAATLVLAVLAIVSLLVTGDISFRSTSSDGGIPQSVVGSVKDGLLLVLLVVQALALLPALRLNDLLRSGAEPRNLAESWFFTIVSSAIVFGVPLWVFGYFAQEDLAGIVRRQDRVAYGKSVDHRAPQLLSKLHIDDWEPFWRNFLIEAEEDVTPNPSRQLLQLMSDALEDHQDIEAIIGDAVDIERSHSTLRDNTWWSRYWIDAVVSPISLATDDVDFQNPSSTDNAFLKMWILRKLRADKREQLTHLINTQWLSNPEFYEEFPESRAEFDKLPQRWTGAKPDDVLTLRRSVRQFAGRVTARAGNKTVPPDPDERLTEAQLYDWRTLQGLNRQMLASYYGASIASPEKIFAYNVLDRDQRLRLQYFGVFFAIFVGLALLHPLNASSLHRFYRSRLAELWLAGNDTDPRQKRLPELATSIVGAPYLLINAAVHFPPSRGKPKRDENDGKPEHSRLLENFLFSKLFCGTNRVGYARSTDYHGGYDLAGAMALSGSAVSPLVIKSLPLRVLLMLSNARLGQWLRNPRRIGERSYLYPTVLSQFWALVNWHPDERKHLFLSDGGHYDNLGLEALLERRTRVVICVDAGNDPQGRFVDLLKTIRRSRAIEGINIVSLSNGEDGVPLDISLAGLRGKLASSHFMVAEIRYPEPPEGLADGVRAAYDVERGFLIYVKPSFTGDEDVALLGYRDENPVFPFDPTIDQFYDQRRFESYRSLGCHIGEKLCSDLLGCDADNVRKHAWLAEWTPDESATVRSHRHSDPILQQCVRLSLTSETHIQRFREALMSPYGPVRMVAAERLGEFGPKFDAATRERILVWLAEAIECEDQMSLRYRMIVTLGRFRQDEVTVKRILQSLSTDNGEVDFAVRWVLEQFDHKQTT